MPVVDRLRSIPGIGLLTATALLAAVADIHRFSSGRHFASYLGLTPRERSTGHRRQLGGITKRGDSYLRMLLIHGARAMLCEPRRRRLRPPTRWAPGPSTSSGPAAITRPPSPWRTRWRAPPGPSGRPVTPITPALPASDPPRCSTSPRTAPSI